MCPQDVLSIQQSFIALRSKAYPNGVSAKRLVGTLFTLSGRTMVVHLFLMQAVGGSNPPPTAYVVVELNGERRNNRDKNSIFFLIFSVPGSIPGRYAICRV